MFLAMIGISRTTVNSIFKQSNRKLSVAIAWCKIK